MHFLYGTITASNFEMNSLEGPIWDNFETYWLVPISLHQIKVLTNRGTITRSKLRIIMPFVSKKEKSSPAIIEIVRPMMTPQSVQTHIANFLQATLFMQQLKVNNLWSTPYWHIILCSLVMINLPFWRGTLLEENCFWIKLALIVTSRRILNFILFPEIG